MNNLPRYSVQTRNHGEGWKTADNTDNETRAIISAMSSTNANDEVRTFDRITRKYEYYKGGRN